MAKKSGGRNASRARRRSFQRAEPRAEAPVVPTPVGPAAEPPLREPISLRRLNPAAGTHSLRRDRRPAGGAVASLPTDYSYVLKDLRQVGILVAVVVLALAILTFILR